MNGLALSARDFLAGKVVEPAFYDVKIDDVEKSLSKAGDSDNYDLKASVIKNSDTGSPEFAGVPVPRWSFNSKAPGFVIPLCVSLGMEPKPGDVIDPFIFKGKTVRIFIGNDEYDGRTVNSLGKIPKYRPING